MSHVHGGRLHEPDVAINAAPRIPPRGIGGIVQPDRQFVLSARDRVGGQIHAPGSITVRPAADQLAIQPYCRVRHGSIYLQENGFARVLRRNAQLLPIPTHAGTGQTAHATAALGSERAFDRPVVRQVHMAPGSVIKAGLRIRDAAAGVPVRPDESAGRFFYEVIARREYPLLNHRRGAIRGC